MSLLFRFRRNKDYSLRNLLRFGIEGSKYYKMADINEVSFSADYSFLKDKYDFDVEQVDKIVDSLRKHIVNSYYIACFDTADQTNNYNMWKEYAGLDGFCLIYDDEDIKNAVYESLINDDHFLRYKKVNYGKKPTDITFFIAKYLSNLGDDLENEEAHEKCADNLIFLLSKKDKEKMMNSMFHKIGNFIEKSEKRIVLQSVDNSSPYCDDLVSGNAKPIKIICSKKMLIFHKQKIIAFANKNKIIFEEIDVDLLKRA